MEEITKICPICKKKFVDKSPNGYGTYCGKACRCEAILKRNKERREKAKYENGNQYGKRELCRKIALIGEKYLNKGTPRKTT